MISHTHLLLANVLLAKPHKPLRNTAVLAGALAPDALLLALFAKTAWAQTMQQALEGPLFDATHFRDWLAASNSVFVYGVLLLAGLLILRAVPAAFRIGLFLTVFALAALTNLAADLPFYLLQTGRYLWPITDIRITLPAHYTNPAAYLTLNWWSEVALGLILTLVLWRRFRTGWVRVGLAVLFAIYLALPAYAVFVLGEKF